MNLDTPKKSYYIYLTFSSILFIVCGILHGIMNKIPHHSYLTYLFIYIGLISFSRWKWYENRIIVKNDQISVKVFFLFTCILLYKTQKYDYDKKLFLAFSMINIPYFYLLSKLVSSIFKSKKSIILHLIMHLFVVYKMIITSCFDAVLC